MPFSTRNAFYLRISSWTVLPLYLYLDERHVDWMTDATLQAVLADLRPKLASKFNNENPDKKSIVEVHRGSSYQFAFFFRKTDSRHVVLLKKRDYRITTSDAPTKAGIDTKPAAVVPKGQKRKRTGNGAINGRESMTPAPAPRGGSVRPDGRGRDGRSVSQTPMREVTEPGIVGDVDMDGAGEVRRSTRSRRETSYAENNEDEEINQYEEDDLVQVKPEPEDSPPLQPIDYIPGSNAPHLPDRTPDQTSNMRDGAALSTGQTDLDTGLEDPEDGFMDYQERGRERIEGSEEPGLRPLVDEVGEEGVMGGGYGYDEDEEEDKKELKPVVSLSYRGFSISSRQLVLIIEPWPPLTNLSSRSSTRYRSGYSRSMSRATGTNDRESTIGGESVRDATPLVPNSRRGGTSVSDRATPVGTPAFGYTSSFGTGTPASTPGPAPGPSNSRNAAASATPTPFVSGSMGPPALPERGPERSETPLFREATPFSSFGDDDEEEEDAEDPDWRERASSNVWAPTRARSESVEPGSFGFRSGLSDEIPGAAGNEEEEEDVQEARGMMELSQRLQSGSERRGGKFGTGGGDGEGEGDGEIDGETEEGVGDDLA